jgi:hypothetical protein
VATPNFGRRELRPESVHTLLTGSVMTSAVTGDSLSQAIWRTGRRPQTLLDEAWAPAQTVGDWLARAAHLEAASVHAFLELAEHLLAHDAPPELVGRCHAAARDEVRHTALMRDLACGRGGAVTCPRVRKGALPSLFELALSNMREGRVRATWGAACAAWQSVRAPDRELRAAMRAIARDEVAHATLARDIHRWIARRLTSEERAQVAAVRASEIARLEREVTAPLPEALRVGLGLPSTEQARTLLHGIEERVWRCRENSARAA